MKNESSVPDMWVLVKMVDAIGVEQRAAPLDAMDGVAFAKQKLGQIGSILPCNAGDQSHSFQMNPCNFAALNLIPSRSYFRQLH
jgi:hypothetical protein